MNYINEKHECIVKYQNAGRCVRLHIDARHDDVVCPDFIRDHWQERLIIDLDPSYHLDLCFSNECVAARLSFGGHTTRCAFPWDSIYVVADRWTGHGTTFDRPSPEARVVELKRTTYPRTSTGRRHGFQVIDGGRS